MKKQIFKGSAVALVTPFDKNDNVNYYVLKDLIDFQIANGTKAIIVLGTTGESSTMSDQEREKIIKFCVCVANKQVPIIVGTGSNSTKKAIELTKQAENLGADGVLIVTPYYNKCNQKGLIKHYTQIASNTKLPIILYNVPSRTGVNIDSKTTLKLSKTPNIVGIKEASGNMLQIAEILNKKPKNFSVFSGDDMLTLPIMSMGGSGVISVTANAEPEKVSLLCEFVLKHDIFNAKRMHDYLYDLNKGLFLDVNPICIKHYLNIMDFNVGKPRMPLTEPSFEIKQKLRDIGRKYEN